jgi:2-iminobutanoate/2-iminopropanoate deaminase
MRRDVILTDKAPKPTTSYSQAIGTEKFLFVAGQAGTDPATGKPPEGIAAQTRQALTNIRAILEAGGSSLENIVKVNVFLVKITDYAEMTSVYVSFFPKNPPARTTTTTDLPPGYLIDIDCIAIRPD